MKKLIAFMIVCGFALVFVSCGGKTESTEESTETEMSAPESEAPAMEEPAMDSVASDTTNMQ